MAYFDETVKIQAPKSRVWEETYEQARKGRIISEEREHLLVATSFNVGYVYWLQADTDGSTILRHLTDSAASVKDAFREHQDIEVAVDSLAARNAQPSLISVVGLLNILGGGNWVGEIGEDTIIKIKKRAEQAH
jgi:hypothetical protein